MNDLDAPVPDTGQARELRRWVCDSDPSRVEHTSFVGWSPCPSCRVIEPSSGDTVQAPDVAALGDVIVSVIAASEHATLVGAHARRQLADRIAAAVSDPDVLRALLGTDTTPEDGAVPATGFDALTEARKYIAALVTERDQLRQALQAVPDTGQAREPRVTVRTTQETTEEWRARERRENPCACGGAFWVGSHSLNGCVGMVEEPSPAPDVAAPCPQHPPIPGHGDELITVPVLGCPTCH